MINYSCCGDKERHAFSPFLRASSATLVLQALQPDERKRVLETGDPSTVSFPTQRKGRPMSEWRSILGDVHLILCAMDSTYKWIWDTDDRRRKAARETIQFWFERVFSGSERCLQDKSRAIKSQVGDSLSEQQWQELCDVLICQRYTDMHKNSRRFPSLLDYRDHLEVEIRKHGSGVKRLQLQSLDAIYSLSGAKTWESLLQKVISRFGLISERETFKIERWRHAAQQCAERLLGRAPMLEVHRTKVKTKTYVRTSEKLRRAAVQAADSRVNSQSSGRTAGKKRKQPTEEVFFKKEWYQVRYSTLVSRFKHSSQLSICLS